MIRKHQELLKYLEVLSLKREGLILEEKYQPKEIIIEQNKRYSWVYIIKKGIIKCYLTDENGKSFVQEFFGQGTEFGEIEVFTKEQSFCCVEAITELEVYKISYFDFNKLLENDKKLNRIILQGLAAKIKYKAPRHSYQHAYSIEDNILKLQKQFPNFGEIISKQDIADYLGITLRSLNRALTSLKDKDLLF